MSKQRFVFRSGFQAGHLNAESVAEELDRIKRENDGRISAEKVVEQAADPESPLHAGFVWDDSVAARLHRLNQARTLIRAVVVIHEDEQPRNVYVHVRDSEETPGGYYPMTVVAKTPSLFDRAVDELQGKLAGASRSLKELTDLAEASARPRRKIVDRIGKHLEAATHAAEGLR